MGTAAQIISAQSPNSLNYNKSALSSVIDDIKNGKKKTKTDFYIIN